MWNESQQWHYDYVRLALDEGFSFGLHKTQNLDKTKLCLIDIDRVIQERDISTIEKCIPTVINFVLDPDQAAVLDSGFVKIFRISQLALEYLLFCKKYLDTTIDLLKKERSDAQQENVELKTFVDELKSHIAVLMKKLKEQTPISSFKCDECPKVFSTETYLTLHKNRRHKVNESLESTTGETDQLQLEIKELKGRLNNTEKLLKTTKNESNEIIHQESNDSVKVIDLQKNFESLKLQVETELKLLKTEKSLENKCDEILEMAVKKVRPIEHRSESVTQTDESAKIIKNTQETERHMKQLAVNVTSKLQDIENQMQSFLNKLNQLQSNKIPVSENHRPQVKSRTKFTKVVSPIKTNEQLQESSTESDFEVEEETKIEVKPIQVKQKSSTITLVPENKAKIHKTESSDNETQLKTAKSSGKSSTSKTVSVTSFKSQEIESSDGETHLKTIKSPGKHSDSKTTSVTSVKVEETESSDSESQVKPTTKLFLGKSSTSSERIGRKTISAPLFKTHKTDSSGDDAPTVKHFLGKLPVSDDRINRKRISVTSPKTRESESSDDETPVRPTTKPSTVSTLGKRSITSLKKIALEKAVLEQFRNEVENIIFGRLQDIGISPYWKRLPVKSYDRAMNIINHQTNLVKKKYSNFDRIRKELERNVAKEAKIMVSNKCSLKGVKKSETRIKLVKEEEENNKPSRNFSKTETESIPKMEINRKLYESDSDSEEQSKKPYAAVIEELKMINKNNESDDSKLENKNDGQKGVLKNPSTGSLLAKKRVNFDFKNPERILGESTTSVESAVLDGTPKRNAQKKLKEIEDLSDFDFSDIA